MSTDTREAPYGYCPECGSAGVARERRPNGNDRCANGHTYPSRNAHKAIAAKTDTREVLAALPPLPVAHGTVLQSGRYGREWYPGAVNTRFGGTAVYTADQMQAYARAALATQPAQPSAQGEAVHQADERGDMAMREWHRECDDADTILRALGLDPVNCRTDGGSLKTGMILDALQARDRMLQRSAPAAPASAQGEARIYDIMALADKMAMHYAARDIPTGQLYRGIAERQWLESRAELRAAIASAPAAPAQAVPSHALAVRAIEELMQLGYTVKDDLLYPPAVTWKKEQITKELLDGGTDGNPMMEFLQAERGIKAAP